MSVAVKRENNTLMPPDGTYSNVAYVGRSPLPSFDFIGGI